MSNQANFRQNKQQTQQLTSLSSNINQANLLQESTNTKLDSLIASAGVLPPALTGSGNLKVCIQELGNEGSERLNVAVGDVAQFPTQLTGAGNLKVSIQEEFNSGMATASNQTSAISHLNTLATASSAQATASNQTAQTSHLNTLATASSSQATATLQGEVSGKLTSLIAGIPAKALTDPADSATSINVKATSLGRLETQLVGSTNSSGSTPHYHITADSNGRLKVVDQYSSTMTNQLTEVNANTTKSRVVSRLTSVAGIPANSGGTAYDLGADFGTYATLKISADVGTSQPMDLYIQISADGVNWNWKTGIGFIGANGGGYMGFFANTSIDQPLRYWRIFNNSGAMASPTLDTLMSIVSVE